MMRYDWDLIRQRRLNLALIDVNLLATGWNLARATGPRRSRASPGPPTAKIYLRILRNSQAERDERRIVESMLRDIEREHGHERQTLQDYRQSHAINSRKDG
jgi:hypothetical protein